MKVEAGGGGRQVARQVQQGCCQADLGGLAASFPKVSVVVSGSGVHGERNVSQFWIALAVLAMNWELGSDL
jgi:hypothetical protein